MAENTYINVKDLPEITEIVNGDYILVETPEGTNIINFENFILPSANTIITTLATQNTNAILTLSSETDAKINNIQQTVSNLSSFLIAKATVIIPTDSSVGTAVLLSEPSNTPPSVNLTIQDIIIVPANEYAAKNSYYISNLSQNVITIQGIFRTQKLALTDPTPITLPSSKVSFTGSTSPLTALSGTTAEGELDINEILNRFEIQTTTSNATEEARYHIFAVKKF